MLVGGESALEQRRDVARDHADAVRIVAEQIGEHQVLGDELRLARVAAARGDDRLDGARQRLMLELEILHSGLIPPFCTTRVQRSTSCCMNLPNSSGLPATTSKPFCCMRALTSGARSAFTVASFSLATMSRGVFAGAAAACQEVTTRSAKPTSPAEGTSGSCGWRFAAVTASAFILPPLM